MKEWVFLNYFLIKLATVVRAIQCILETTRPLKATFATTALILGLSVPKKSVSLAFKITARANDDNQIFFIIILVWTKNKSKLHFCLQKEIRWPYLAG